MVVTRFTHSSLPSSLPPFLPPPSVPTARVVVINDARHAFEPEYLQRVVPYFFELKKVRRREGGREGGEEGEAHLCVSSLFVSP